MSSSFSKKQYVKITQITNIPADAFNDFEQVYGKCITAADLRREYTYNFQVSI